MSWWISCTVLHFHWPKKRSAIHFEFQYCTVWDVSMTRSEYQRTRMAHKQTDCGWGLMVYCSVCQWKHKAKLPGKSGWCIEIVHYLQSPLGIIALSLMWHVFRNHASAAVMRWFLWRLKKWRVGPNRPTSSGSWLVDSVDSSSLLVSHGRTAWAK